ncbi:MAG: signal peptide peptidase SppA [candidate division WOR-3 bacterium]|nr:signal peptide peptidase SppA [candidate division WOR-3 bacterium]
MMILFKILPLWSYLLFMAAGDDGSIFCRNNIFLLAPPGASGIGLYGYDNPALLTYLHNFDLAFIWSGARNEENGFDGWRFFAGIPRLSLAIGDDRFPYGSCRKYNLSFAMGDKKQSFGIGYEWSVSDTSIIPEPVIWKLGGLIRPRRFLSLGVVGLLPSQNGYREVYLDAGFRPTGNEIITFFFDCIFRENLDFKDSPWSTGFVLEPLRGIRLTTRYFNDRAIKVGVNIGLGRIGGTVQSCFDSKQRRKYDTYGIRFGALDRSIFRDLLGKNKNYLKLELNGKLNYQRYMLFDKSNTLLSILNTIDVAKRDPSIRGIAINLSGIEINWEMAWELREKFKDFKSNDKYLLVYIDEVRMPEYYLASIANLIVIDPQGGINLQGLLMGRMFFKNALDKLGIGVDEWRYFKYKSAAEILSRDKMSEADREQRQAIIDDFYNTIKNEVCESRGLSPEDFEKLVNEDVVLLPEDAVKKNLADTTGRWDEIEEIVKQIEGKEKGFVDKSNLVHFRLPKDDYWGEEPKIAIIYGIGECAMDTGIRARSLIKDFEWVMDRKDIKAVVFRVDSPGGSALASDIIAEAIRKCQKKKPVIVSQGMVAGSGGYWLSMYGNRIVASPFTITGSIGVIGLWLYNKDLKERLGLSTDFVKVGEHADLGFGFNYPFLGQLPDRNLTEIEKQKMESMIKSLYHDFVSRVAQGRNKGIQEIEEIAQGRVWSGIRGKEIGLVDTIGGIEAAINIAKEMAGLKKDERINVIELPRPELLPPDLFQPRIIGEKTQNEEFIRYLKLLSENNGKALLIMPLEYLYFY